MINTDPYEAQSPFRFSACNTTGAKEYTANIGTTAELQNTATNSMRLPYPERISALSDTFFSTACSGMLARENDGP
ncbi:hypothetical protein D3C76_602000 [compost metagenome]